MKSTLKTTLIVLFILNSLAINAQVWTPITALETQNKAKKTQAISPSKYQLFSLNSEQLKSILKNTTSRGSKKMSGSIIELPTANGVLQKFHAQVASVLDSDLAKRFPDIKSYVAYGIDDPTSVARFSFSQIGLHAIISSANYNTILINPYTKDKKDYICYAKKDLPASIKPFECHVKDEAQKKSFQGPSKNFRNANDGILRTFRLALACTGEYAQYHLTDQGVNPTASDAVKKSTILAVMNDVMTQVNFVFERDLGVTMVFVAQNTDIIFLDAATDGLTNNDDIKILDENQTICDNIIGSSNYDIGHVLRLDGGGRATVGNVCNSTVKARATTGLDPYDFSRFASSFSHEIGHQFGASHTQNNRCNRTVNSVEPGSGSTIMSYGGACHPNVQSIRDQYFHGNSIEEMWNNINTGNSICAQLTNTGNIAPTADAGADFTIPTSTPFILKGSGSDSDSGDVLTYCWEQMDNEVATMPPSAFSTIGPTFRTLPPIASPDRYMPAIETVIAGQISSTWEVVPSVGRIMNFRLTVRDNAPMGGNTASDDTEITVSGDAGPFVVSNPNTNISWVAGSNQTVTWNVAGTTGNGINAANIDILLSTDGGNTYPITIVSSVTNDGSQDITVPNEIGTQNRIMVRGSGHIFYDISDTNFSIIDDTQIPTDATELAASNLLPTSFDLTWNPSTDNTEVLGYHVYIDGVLDGHTATTSYSFTGLTPDATSSVSVIAFDTAGNKSSPTAISVTTPITADTQAPTNITGLASSNIMSAALNISWTTSTDNVGVTGYNVYLNGILNGTTTTNSYSFSDLTPDTLYGLDVIAFDAAGNESTPTGVFVSTTTDTQAPSAVTDLSLSTLNLTSFGLSWVPSTDNDIVTEYNVFIDGILDGTTDTTSYFFSGLSPNTHYSVSVVAFDPSRNNSTPTTISVNTLPDTQAPTDTFELASSNLTPTTFDILWMPSVDNIEVIGYFVYLNEEYVATTTYTSYSFTGMSPNTTHSVSVVAFDAAGNISTPATISVIIDTQPPTPITGLTVLNLNTTSFDLSWIPSTDNINVTGYNVYIDGNLVAETTDTSYSFSGLTPDTTYRVSVIAIDAAENESTLTAISVTTPIATDTQAPTDVTGLTSSNLTATAFTLSWMPSNDNIGVIGYNISIDGFITTSSNSSFSFTELSPNTSYTVYVSAYDSAGNESTPTAISITTQTDTQAPTPVNDLSLSTQNISTFSLSWIAATDNDAVAGYDVYIDGILEDTTFSTSYFFRRLTPNTGYNFSVVAFDAAGNRSTPTIISVIVDTQAPTDVNNLASSNLTATGFDVSWIPSTDNFDVTGYDVYIDGVLDGNTATTSYSIIGLAPNITYSVSVVAFDAAGNESTPTAISITTLMVPDIQAPAHITDLTSLNITTTTFDISWMLTTDNIAVTGYDVYINEVLYIRTHALTSSYSLSGLTPDTNYIISVIAFDAAGNESMPTVVSVTTIPDLQSPTEVTDLTSSNLTATSFDVSWTASTDDIAVERYNVYLDGELDGSTDNTSYSFTGVARNKTDKVSVPKDSYKGLKLSPNTTYSISVIAVDFTGNESTSTTISVKTPPDTQAPTTITNFIASNITSTSLDFTWSASTDNVGVTGYNVFVGGVLNGTTTNTSYSLSGLTPNTNYSVSVVAFDATGNESENFITKVFILQRGCCSP